MRVNPVLPFGWTNAILGVWEIPFPSFLASSVLGCQVDLLMKTNVGVLLRAVGDIGDTTPEAERVLRMQFMLNLAVLVVTLATGLAYSRWIMKNVMPRQMRGEEEEKAYRDRIANTVGH